jgi:hypothetical protein
MQSGLFCVHAAYYQKEVELNSVLFIKITVRLANATLALQANDPRCTTKACNVFGVDPGVANATSTQIRFQPNAAPGEYVIDFPSCLSVVEPYQMFIYRENSSTPWQDPVWPPPVTTPTMTTKATVTATTRSTTAVTPQQTPTEGSPTVETTLPPSTTRLATTTTAPTQSSTTTNGRLFTTPPADDSSTSTSPSDYSESEEVY